MRILENCHALIFVTIIYDSNAPNTRTLDTLTMRFKYKPIFTSLSIFRLLFVCNVQNCDRPLRPICILSLFILTRNFYTQMAQHGFEMLFRLKFVRYTENIISQKIFFSFTNVSLPNVDYKVFEEVQSDDIATESVPS